MMSGCVIRCERPKKMWGPKRKIGGRIVLGGGRKKYLAVKHHNEAAPKKKKSRGLSAWAPKNTTLRRLRSKGLEKRGKVRCGKH